MCYRIELLTYTFPFFVPLVYTTRLQKQVLWPCLRQPQLEVHCASYDDKLLTIKKKVARMDVFLA